ncbi:MAG: TIGR02281 family clan AA aspartic protease [Burkholderiales bacterium]|nr:MAG: TIGR02281 family clan AA aspartic protease [Burkholderiales bacterium]
MTHRRLPSLVLTLFTATAGAADVAVVGVFPPAKAVLVIDGRGPFTVPVGGTRDGVRVQSVDATGATLEIEGRTLSLAVGSAPMRADPDHGQRVVIAPDERGHYLANGSVDGAAVRFMVDTGATAVTIPGDLARKLGIDLSQAQRVRVNTANGQVTAHRVRLDRVTLGTMTLMRVDAIVQENLGDQALLGMTFLSRTDLRREGDRLVLTKRH